MSDDEWLARRKRIQDAVAASDNRVKDFIELVATMCVSRTTRRNARVVLDQYIEEETPLQY